MKTTILSALIALLSATAVMGQDDIRATISYNKSDSTLTIEVKNISNKVITVRNQSRYTPTSGSSVQLGYQRKDGKMGYHLAGLSNESTRRLWDDFTVMNPSETRSCIYNHTIKFYGQGRPLTEVEILISYSFKDSSGKRIRSSYVKLQTF